MKIIGLTDIDTFVKTNDLKEVTTQQMYYRTNETFHPQGLFSEEIFGQTEDERSYRCGYIKLPIHIFNPQIAKTIILRSGGIIKKMAYGETTCSIQNGVLKADPEGRYIGLRDLYDIWDQIDLEKTLTTKSDVNINILKKTPKRLLFNDKVLILPPNMRRTGMRNGKQVKSELNTIYMKILGLKSLLAHSTTNMIGVYSKMQDAVCDIYTYINNLVSGKGGFFQKNLLAKPVLWTNRNVISAPRYNEDDTEIGIYRTGYPLHTCISLFEPLVRFQLKQLLSYQYLESIHPVKGEINISDIENMYDNKAITDMCRIYMKNPGSRFNILYMDPESTKPIQMQYLDLKTNETVTRPITLTDIMYLACKAAIVDADRLVYCVRYPIGDHLGCFFTRVAVLSTNERIRIQFNGETYNYYPKIDLEMPHARVATNFAETITPSNSRLKAIGGDYDGDTVKSTGIFSDEANEKAHKLMYAKIYNVTAQCSTPFEIGMECVNGLYSLTKM